MKNEILIASGNVHKMQEIQSLLPHINFISPNALSLDINPDETGASFLENALIKAKAFYHAMRESADKKINMHTKVSAVLSEDSGLCVDALGGKPGIYSARYKMNEFSQAPKEKQDTLFQCRKLLEEMQGCINRSAYFVCCAVILWGEEEYAVHQSIWRGSVAEEIKGENGFGYDPIFFVGEKKCVSAQLSEAEKNQYSHRAKAMKGLSPTIEAVSDMI